MSPRWVALLIALLWGIGSSLTFAQPGEPGVSVWLDDMHAVTYRARIQGDWIVVRAEHEPGWHTYAMDNVARARKKSAKAQPETELPTVVTPGDGLSIAGEWRQSPPLDLSTPEIRWYTWGFEGRSYFAARIEEPDEASSEPWVQIDAQACTESLCAMVEALKVPIDSSNTDDSWSVDVDALVVVASDDVSSR